MKLLGKTYSVIEWDGQKLGNKVTIDTETTVVPSYHVPELVLCQAYGDLDPLTVYFIPKERIKAFLDLHKKAALIFHNAAFDVRVLEEASGIGGFFQPFYDDSRIWDTSILYRLLHLAVVGFIPFKYNLALLAKKFLNIELEKNNDIRMTFYPGMELTQKHQEYAAKDVVVTHLIYKHLMAEILKTGSTTFLSHNIQAAGDYVLKRVHENGIGFDLDAKYKWMADANTKLEEYQNRLATWGWVRGVKGIKSRFEDIVTQLGLTLPRTESGDISSKAEDLQPYRQYQFIDDYLKFMELEKATTFIRDLDNARVHPRYNILVNTGRTSCSAPNFQQLPRVGGIREIFCAKPNHTLLITDYSAIELATLAQVLLDKYQYSEMAEQLNIGVDLHRYYASILFNKPEKDITKDERQKAKAANFGFPGGLGLDTFIEFSSGYGLDITRQEAQVMKDKWFEAFPEMAKYLRGEKGVVMTRTGRIRGDTTFCAEKNTPFQGLAADGAKLAMWNLYKAGFKIVGFVHDEILTEVPEEKVEKMLLLQEKIMIESMGIVVPDVKISVESQISRTYTK
jgi:DNA polymerase I-like protein with 3'-5' exonuclease and polymerase domains